MQQMEKRERRRTIDLVALVAILFTIETGASSFVAIRVCLGALTALDLAAARYVAAGLIALLRLVAKRPPLPGMRDLFRLGLAGVIRVATRPYSAHACGYQTRDLIERGSGGNEQACIRLGKDPGR